MLQWMCCVRPEYPPEDYIVQNSSGDTLFTKAMWYVLVRRAPASPRSSCGSPLQARADSRRGKHGTGLITSNRDDRASSIQERPEIHSHGNGHLLWVWF